MEVYLVAATACFRQTEVIAAIKNKYTKMKTVTFLILLLSSTFVFSQTKIVIDTITVNYRIKDIVDITSYIPQIKGEINAVAKDKINSDIKKYFMAGISKDSTLYVRELLEYFDLSTVEEYLELDQSEIMPDEEAEEFEITYLSENLLNLTYSYQNLYRGRYQFFFISILYDLRTGNKLNFDDFLSIEKDTLISIFRKNGYRIDSQSDPDTPIFKAPIDEYDEYVGKNIDHLFDKEGFCIEFYFTEKDNELHLMFKFDCAGPYLVDYGIELSHLKPFIKYSEFKNRFKLWGKDIYSLIGYDYLTLENKIDFEDYSIFNTGNGYLLAKDNKQSNDEFGVVICSSSTHIFYLFLKYQTIGNNKKAIILDILEIDKIDLAGKIMTEYCETTKGADAEVLALVKDTKGNPEYHTKIVKAWRLNRKTGKFEVVERKKVKRCGNEGYGI